MREDEDVCGHCKADLPHRGVWYCSKECWLEAEELAECPECGCHTHGLCCLPLGPQEPLPAILCTVACELAAIEGLFE